MFSSTDGTPNAVAIAFALNSCVSSSARSDGSNDISVGVISGGITGGAPFRPSEATIHCACNASACAFSSFRSDFRKNLGVPPWFTVIDWFPAANSPHAFCAYARNADVPCTRDPGFRSICTTRRGSRRCSPIL